MTFVGDSGRRIALYGGTFDPPHFGHLSLAIDMVENLGYDEIWFCPARQNPHKEESSKVPKEHRIKMLELALSHLPCARVVDLELNRSGPSYMIDTVEELLGKLESNTKLELIMGQDLVGALPRWKRIEDLVKKISVRVGLRPGYDFEKTGNNLIDEWVEKGCVTTRSLEISGTELRSRLAAGKICVHLLPTNVLDYIKENQLYS